MHCKIQSWFAPSQHFSNNPFSCTFFLWKSMGKYWVEVFQNQPNKKLILKAHLPDISKQLRNCTSNMTNPEIHGMIGIFHRRSKSCEIISFMWKASPNSYIINPSCSLGCSVNLCASGKGKDAQPSSYWVIWCSCWENILLVVFPLGKKTSLSCSYHIPAGKEPGTEIPGFKDKVQLLQTFQFSWKLQIKGHVRRYLICDSCLKFLQLLVHLCHMVLPNTSCACPGAACHPAYELSIESLDLWFRCQVCCAP